MLDKLSGLQQALKASVPEKFSASQEAAFSPLDVIITSFQHLNVFRHQLCKIPLQD